MSYPTEASMVADFVEQLHLRWRRRECPWTVYPETAGWDLLLLHRSGLQLGLEAKLSLNAKVISQALAGQHRAWNPAGPDYRGVLVPAGKVQHCLADICDAIGIGIVTVRPREQNVIRHFNLPDPDAVHSDWPNWAPAQRCALPEYIPDVQAGKPAPVALTEWKIKAIKLMIVLERRGFVTRSDMNALKISPSRWTDCWHGFLSHDKALKGWVRNDRTPDLRAQHPRNYVEIEADFDTWASLAQIDASLPETLL